MRLTAVRGAVLAAILFAGPLAAEPTKEPSFTALAEATYGPIVQDYDLPGLAVGVVFEGETFFYTTGVADQARATPVTPDTVFELGSVSKLFTVTLAAIADDRGALSLDGNVADALSPGFATPAGHAFERITLDDFAAHATGDLPLQVPSHLDDQAALFDWLAEWSPEHSPEATRAYSNVSIGLLGLVSGQALSGSYEQSLKDHVFAELGLDSTFVTPPETGPETYAYGYAIGEDGPIRVNPGLLADEAYGVKSSVKDMLRFLAAHLEGADISKDMERALRRTRSATYDTAHFAQAMIWEAYAWPPLLEDINAGNTPDMALKPQPMTRRDEPLSGPILYSKTGSTNGFGAYVALVPHRDIGVVVLANRRYPNPVRVKAALALMEAVMTEPALVSGSANGQD